MSLIKRKTELGSELNDGNNQPKLLSDSPLGEIELQSGQTEKISCSQSTEQRIINAGLGIAKLTAVGSVMWLAWSKRGEIMNAFENLFKN